MLTIKPAQFEDIIEIEVNGKVSKNDIEGFEAYVESRMADGRNLNLLMELHNLDGYTVKGLMEGFKFDMKHWNEFHKIAVISEKQWLEFSTKLSSLLPKMTMKHFKSGEKDAAIEWLR